MVAIGYCPFCLPKGGGAEPEHCFGHEDRFSSNPDPEFCGGFYCTCPCRDWTHIIERKTT